MENENAILEKLERLDLHWLLAHGMPDAAEGELKILTSAYLHSSLEGRNLTKSLVTQRVSSVILVFARRMATLAMQEKDLSAVDLGLAAVDLSRIMLIDFREVFGIAGELAFAAHRCDVDVLDRARVVIPDISNQLLIALETPLAPRVLEDLEGNLTFWNAWRRPLQPMPPRVDGFGISLPERQIKVPPDRRRKR
jgi:hypothetical protein